MTIRSVAILISMIVVLAAVRLLREEWRIWRGTETAEQQRRRLARDQRLVRRQQQADQVGTFLLGVLGVLIVGAVMVVSFLVFPPLSGTEVLLLVILFSMRNDCAKG